MRTVRVDRKSLRRLISQAVYEACGMEPDMRAWIKQRDKAWVVYWMDGGRQRQRSCGEGPEGRSLAKKLCRQVSAEITLGQAPLSSNKTWADFTDEYRERILAGKSESHRAQALKALSNFDRIAKPGRVDRVTTAMLDGFTAKRRTEKGRKSPLVSPSTVNADLRQLKTAFKIAVEWGYLRQAPRVRKEREPQRLPRYITPDEFDRLYAACKGATLPDVRGIDPAKWWRGLLTTLYLTGWRIGETLALRRADVDLKASTARLPAEVTKGRREELVGLHPVILSHLKQLRGFWEQQFHWPHHRRTLTAHLAKLCVAAKIPAYGFHDFRRAFGTLNAARVTPRVLQFLMRHKSGQTTQRFYVNPAEELAEATGRLFVPRAVGG